MRCSHSLNGTKRTRPPDYSVEIATQRYSEIPAAGGTFGRLLKIHGSLNWLSCERCKRTRSVCRARGCERLKALDELYHSVPLNDA